MVPLRQCAEVDHPATYGRGVLRPVAGVVTPQQPPGLGIQGIHVVVVGPYVHRPAGHGWGRPYDVVRLKAPQQLSGLRVQGIHVVVVRPCIDRAVDHGRRIDNPASGGIAPEQGHIRLRWVGRTGIARQYLFRNTAQEADRKLQGCNGGGRAGVRQGTGNDISHIGVRQQLSQAPFSLLGQPLHPRNKGGEE